MITCSVLLLMHRPFKYDMVYLYLSIMKNPLKYFFFDAVYTYI